MRDDISQEALIALARVRHQKARERLRRDGGESLPAMQRRIQALAAERSIPPADYRKLMYKRVSTRDVMVFGKKYRVNFDWLLCGDLKGLQQMKQEAKPEFRPRTGLPTKEFVALYSPLPLEQKQMITAFLKELVDRKGKPDGGDAA